MYQTIRIVKDYSRPEHAGASGLFQVESVIAIDENENEIDLTDKVDQGKMYHDNNELLADLGLPADTTVEDI